MPERHFSIFLPAVIGVIALPTVAALLHFKLTGDPTSRPLGIDVANLTNTAADGKSAGINVDVRWGADVQTPNTKGEVKLALSNALGVYGIDYRVMVTDTAGATIEIFYVVGDVRIGPFRLGNAAAGISPALAAYHMDEIVQETRKD